MFSEDRGDVAFIASLLNGSAARPNIEAVAGADAVRALQDRDPDDVLVLLYGYWKGLARTGGIPAAADVSPAGINPAALPSVVLLDVVDDAPRRYRYRLVGTAIEAVFGADYTGRFMDEIVPPDLYDHVKQAYDMTCDGGMPVVFTGSYVRDSGEYFNVTRVALPLADEAGRVTSILSALAREKIPLPPTGDADLE